MGFPTTSWWVRMGNGIRKRVRRRNQVRFGRYRFCFLPTLEQLESRLVPADYFVVQGMPTSLAANETFSFTVTAKDATTGSTATGYTGSVHFSSTDPSAVLPADSTLASGTGIFSATFKTSGSQSITVTASGGMLSQAPNSPFSTNLGNDSQFDAPVSIVASDFTAPDSTPPGPAQDLRIGGFW